MNKKTNAYMAAISYALIIGLSFIFVKITLTVSAPLDTLAHRFTVALLGATVFMLLSKNRVKFSWQDIKGIIPLAILYPILFFAFQIFGLAQITSSEAGIIQATIPIFTILFAVVILKEKSNKRQLIYAGLSVLGVIYLFIMSGVGLKASSILGSVFIICSAITAALYNVLARKLTQKYSLFSLTYMMTLVGFVTFNMLALGKHTIDGTIIEFFKPFLHIDFVIAILYLGILSSFVTSFLSNYALSVIEAGKMSVFSNLATLITIIAGVVYLKEAFHFHHIIGGIIILVGVLGINMAGTKKK